MTHLDALAASAVVALLLWFRHVLTCGTCQRHVDKLFRMLQGKR